MPDVPAGTEVVAGPLLPGMADLHSHAFQRAMAGLAEVAGTGPDSFWTWRDTMYRLVGRLSPEDVETISTWLQIELLKGGYTSVAEFHYLHHNAESRPFDNPAEMALRILAAAGQSGIGLTLLPVFYAHSGFGAAAPQPEQRRFIHDVDGFLALMDRLAGPAMQAGATLGLALHSLRAATVEEMRHILAALPGEAYPIHIHVAEQEGEVEACLAWSGRRPVAYLLDEMPVGRRWCLVHATHIDEAETLRLVASRAVVGLCPATEASLGDGIFPAVDYRAAGGRFGIGTDSHVATGVAEELRLLEYGQRLRDRRRNRLADGPGRSVGRSLFDAALAGGAQALGQGPPGIVPGARADFIVLDGADPFIAMGQGDALLDRWIFALGDRAIRHVMVRGQWRVRDGRHALDGEIGRAFRDTLSRLTA
jgi:formimidoylglutamate deiminase